MNENLIGFYEIEINRMPNLTNTDDPNRMYYARTFINGDEYVGYGYNPIKALKELSELLVLLFDDRKNVWSGGQEPKCIPTHRLSLICLYDSPTNTLGSVGA